MLDGLPVTILSFVAQEARLRSLLVGMVASSSTKRKYTAMDAVPPWVPRRFDRMIGWLWMGASHLDGLIEEGHHLPGPSPHILFQQQTHSSMNAFPNVDLANSDSGTVVLPVYRSPFPPFTTLELY